MDNTGLIHREACQIKGYDVDQNLLMKTTALIRHMHDTAIDQIIKLKVSAHELQPLGLGWVLVHQDLIIRQMPSLGQRIEITTYPSGKDRLYTYRDYLAKDLHGRVLATASTTWVLMDIKHRRAATVYPTYIKDLLSASNQMPALPRASLGKLKMNNFTHEKAVQPTLSEIDFNGHVSNHYFFKWMLDSMPIQFLQGHDNRRFNIKFRGESFVGDALAIRCVIKQRTVFHEIVKNDVQLAYGTSEWAPKTEDPELKVGDFLTR